MQLKIYPQLAKLPARCAYQLAEKIAHQEALQFQPSSNSDLSIFIRGLSQLSPESMVDQNRVDEFLFQRARMMAFDHLDCYIMPKLFSQKHAIPITLRGDQHLKTAQEKGSGVILLISHFGRFFMLGPGLGLNQYPFAMLTTPITADNPAYAHPGTFQYWHQKLTNTLAFSGDEHIVTSDPLKRIFRLLKQNKIVLIAFDGTETNSPDKLTVPFFQQTLSLPMGALRVAEKSNAQLIYAATHNAKKGHGVEIKFHPLPQQPLAAIKEAVTILEKELTQEPWYWWQWPALNTLCPTMKQ
jgi:lauroyl/myristoyl acyltransferase